MTDIKYWRQKIRDKRKTTDFRNFLKEIPSWYPIVLERNNGIISKFPNTSRVKKVVKTSEFEKNRDDLVNKGFNYDFSLDFFENYKKLFMSLDLFNLVDYGGNQNCEFSDSVLNSKNSYLCFGVINNCENTFYSISVKDNCTNVFNSFAVWENSEIVFNSTLVSNSFKVFFSKYIYNSNEVYFSTNLVGCKECLFCDNLDNVSYAIENKVYKKQEYLKKKDEMLKKKDKFHYWYKLLNKKGNNINSVNIDGNSVMNSQDVEKGYYSYNMKNSRNILIVGGIDGCENVYDTILAGAPYGNDFYGVLGVNGENIYSSMNIVASSNIFYSYLLNDSSNCIGCIGLKNKQYCIMNKQYSKEEYEVLSDKIFAQMDKDKLLGKFFPGELCPYYFNDTFAGLFGNFTKKEALKDGFLWRDNEIKVDIPDSVKVINTGDLKNYEGFDSKGKWFVKKEILDVAIKDKKGNYYKILETEFDFLNKYGLPIPRLHWLDRMKFNFGI